MNSADPLSGKLGVSIISGDVREMHRRPEFAGALFQFASQFNLLEMIGPNKTPEDGVTIYQSDRKQGPACGMAAGTPGLSGEYAACLDFSIAKGGFLTAYRWSGEDRLSQRNLVYVEATRTRSTTPRCG